MPKVENLKAGQWFGCLLLINIAEPNVRDIHVKWIAKCKCGFYCQVIEEDIVEGLTENCGGQSTKHIIDIIDSPIYKVYYGMVQRCTNEKEPRYKDYGGRGIYITWKSFEEFYYDMWPSYRKGLTLDRRDNNGPYSKENCRWATPEQQANNMRNNVWITHEGETLTASQWARRLHIPPDVLYLRKKLGWSDELIITTAVKIHRKSTLSVGKLVKSDKSSNRP